MSSFEHFGSSESLVEKPDLTALAAAGVEELGLIEKLEGLTAGDVDAPKLKGFLTGAVVEAFMKVDAKQVKEAAKRLMEDSEIQKLGTPEEIKTALDRLENLANGNIEVTKTIVAILLAVFAPKEGIPALLNSGTDGIRKMLQAIYTNGQIIGNLSVEARIDGVKMKKLEEAKANAAAEGVMFDDTEYEDPKHLRFLGGIAKLLDCTVIKMQHLTADAGTFTLEAVESVLHGTKLLAEDKTFTAGNDELIQMVTREGLSPMEKKILVKFLREVVIVASTKQVKEAIVGGHIKGIAQEEHDKEVAATATDTAPAEETDATDMAA